MRCAIYARFSTDRQNEKSAEDQVSDCRRYAEQQGWEVVEVYSDLAISGASNRRPGMTAMLSDAAAGAFSILLAEDLDRIARDLEDVAGMYKRLRFADVALFTIANGEINDLHIGFKGTMDAIELRKIGEKVKRGQRGNLSRGRVPGGLCYGYDIVREFDGRGRLIGGRRRINPELAAIVRRIYEAIAAGRSPRALAKELNAEGVPAPRGGEWRASTIVGNRGRQVGILHNPIYVGRFVYGRVKGKRDPDTRNRVWQTTTSGDREIYDLPELRIVEDELWQQVQDVVSRRAAEPLVRRKRAKRLLSGLVKCGECGGNFTVFANDRLCCSRAREAGTCANGTTIRMAELERRVLAGLKGQLLSPEAVALLVREYHLERDRRLKEDAVARRTLERRLAQAQTGVANLVAAIEAGGGAFADLREALARKVEERDLARSALAEQQAEQVIAFHPNIADAYRQRIERLTAGAVEEMSEATREDIRSLVEAIMVRPAPNRTIELEIIGSFEAAIAVASGRPLPQRGTRVSVKVVAGVGFEPTTFRL